MEVSLPALHDSSSPLQCTTTFNTTTAINNNNIEEHKEQDPNSSVVNKPDLSYWILLLINYTSLFVGSISSSLLSRLYFEHGGSNRWVSTWVQSAGFPLLLIPIYLINLPFKTHQTRRPFSQFTPKLFTISISIGIFMGINNFLFSWGISYLSVSTSSLLLSSQLAFNLVLSVLLVKQPVTVTNMNCVMLLTLSSVLLALGPSQDHPIGVTKTQYYLGFVSILGAAVLFALYLPLMEMVYRKVYNYEMVMETQVVMEIAATVFATIGMISDSGFEAMKRESRNEFHGGVTMYWLTVGFNVVSWQLCFLGTAGIVYLTSSLNGGICMTALLPMNVVGGVVAFGDSFGGEKVVSTVLCVWGFLSYLYGEYVKKKKNEREEEVEMVVNGV